MPSRNLARVLAAGVVAFAVAAPAVAQTVTNGSFESGLTGWTSTGLYHGTATQAAAPVESNSMWDNGANDGSTSVAWMELWSGNNPSLSDSLDQTVSGFDPALTYTISYLENGRQFTSSAPGSGGTGAGDVLLTLLVDGVAVVPQHEVTPVAANSDYTVPFTSVTSAPFTVPSGTAAISFLANMPVNGTDATVLLDNVVINVVPEPTAIGLLGLGAAGLLARRRRR